MTRINKPARVLPHDQQDLTILETYKELGDLADRHIEKLVLKVGNRRVSITPSFSTNIEKIIGPDEKTAKKNARVALRWHDLRHTAVTRLLESGQSLPMVASIMGWSASTTVRMAQSYGHISTDARRAAMEAMNSPRPRCDDAIDTDGEKADPVH